MSRAPLTVPMVFVRRLLSGVHLDPGQWQRWLRDAGVQPAQLDAADAHVTAEQFIAVFETFVLHLDDEALGFLSRPLRCGSYALMARSAASAPTLEVAIRRTAHTFRLLQDDARLVLRRDHARAGVALEFSKPEAIPDAAHDFFLRVFWRLFSWLVGDRLKLSSYDFAYAGDESVSPGLFPAARRFAQKSTAMWFDAAVLAQPVCRDDTALREFLRRSFAEVIVPRRDQGVAGRVKHFLRQSLPEWPGLDQAAQAMHMAASTLQRHLASEGTSFQLLKNALRRDVAIYRLQTSQVSLARLADELGFADSTAFQRAFKQWTGRTPGSYPRHGG